MASKQSMTDSAIGLLIKCCTLDSWCVDSDNFLDAAALVAREYVYIYDNGEGLSIAIQDKGREWALRQGLIRPDASAMYQPFSTTEKGERFKKSDDRR